MKLGLGVYFIEPSAFTMSVPFVGFSVILNETSLILIGLPPLLSFAKILVVIAIPILVLELSGLASNIKQFAGLPVMAINCSKGF